MLESYRQTFNFVYPRSKGIYLKYLCKTTTTLNFMLHSGSLKKKDITIRAK